MDMPIGLSIICWNWGVLVDESHTVMLSNMWQPCLWSLDRSLDDWMISDGILDIKILSTVLTWIYLERASSCFCERKHLTKKFSRKSKFGFFLRKWPPPWITVVFTKTNHPYSYFDLVLSRNKKNPWNDCNIIAKGLALTGSKEKPWRECGKTWFDREGH